MKQQFPQQQMDPVQLAWLAGLLEGEGYFGFTERTMRGKPHVDLIVTIRMTDKDIIDRAAAIMGRCSCSTQNRTDKNWKMIHQAKCSGRAAADLMRALFPLMGERRNARINEALNVWDFRPVKKMRANQPAACHPERANVAGGLCRPCYKRNYDKARRAAQKAAA